MTDLLWILILLTLVTLYRACRTTPPPPGTDFLQAMASGRLPTSKKQHTRGDLDHYHRTRRQRAHARRQK